MYLVNPSERKREKKRKKKHSAYLHFFLFFFPPSVNNVRVGGPGWGGGGVREWVKKKKLAGFEDLEIGGISSMYRGVFSPVYTFYIILHSVWGVNIHIFIRNDISFHKAQIM